MKQKAPSGLHDLIQAGLITVMETPEFKSFFIEVIRNEVAALEAAGILQRTPRECMSVSQS